MSKDDEIKSKPLWDGKTRENILADIDRAYKQVKKRTKSGHDHFKQQYRQEPMPEIKDPLGYLRNTEPVFASTRPQCRCPDKDNPKGHYCKANRGADWSWNRLKNEDTPLDAIHLQIDLEGEDTLKASFDSEKAACAAIYHGLFDVKAQLIQILNFTTGGRLAGPVARTAEHARTGTLFNHFIQPRDQDD